MRKYSKYLRQSTSTFGSSYVIVLQTVTDKTNIAIANTESRMWPFNWYIFIFDIVHSKAQGQGHAHFHC